MSAMGIGSVGAYNQAYSSQNAQRNIASGSKINSAADDAAGLAIAKKLENQSNGASVAANNAYDMKNLLNVAGGGLNEITNGLGRIRELALQSMNGIYTDSDRGIFQEEINGILSNINDIANNANFNGKSILDGSFTAQSAVIGPNGQSMDVSIGSALTDALGISGFDVTSGNFSLESIDNAIETVSTLNSDTGAYSNRLEYSARAMENASYNMEVSRSRIEDTDVAEASSEQNRNRITEEVGLSMQKMRMQSMGNFLQLIG